MWLFLPWGFFSVVAHRDDPATLLVRSRAFDHLAQLAERLDAAAPGSDYALKIRHTPEADYPLRLPVARADLDAFMTGFIQDELTYDNFKRAASREGFGFLDALHEVWATMRRTADEPAD